MHAPRKTMGPIHYPDDDGQPMSDNTLQFEWIQLLTANLSALFYQRADVFVGGNLLWYPVEGFPKVRQAPDALVVFGRPTQYRGSYRQWEEDNVPITVVFEVRSPGDSDRKMSGKLKFYDTHGVEEYYVIDPEANTLQVYHRPGPDHLLGPVRLTAGAYSSPRLGIRFVRGKDAITVYRPEGRAFLTATEMEAEIERATNRAARLQELALRVVRGQATPEEIAELESL